MRNRGVFWAVFAAVLGLGLSGPAGHEAFAQTFRSGRTGRGGAPSGGAGSWSRPASRVSGAPGGMTVPLSSSRSLPLNAAPKVQSPQERGAQSALWALPQSALGIPVPGGTGDERAAPSEAPDFSPAPIPASLSPAAFAPGDFPGPAEPISRNRNAASPPESARWAPTQGRVAARLHRLKNLFSASPDAEALPPAALEEAARRDPLAPARLRPAGTPAKILGLGGLLTVMAAGPPMLAAEGIGTGGLLALARDAASGPWLEGIFGLPFSPLAFVALSFALAAIKIALNNLVLRLNAAHMPGPEVKFSPSLAKTVPLLILAAGVEEWAFRVGLFMSLSGLLGYFLGPPAGFALGALGAAMVFSLIHRYGYVWTRVAGALYYSGLLLLTGSLWVPTAVHFLQNLFYYLAERGRAGAAPPSGAQKIARLILNPGAPGAAVAAAALLGGHVAVSGLLDRRTGRVLSAGPGLETPDAGPGQRRFTLTLEPGQKGKGLRRLRAHFGLRPKSFLAMLFP